MKTIQKKPVFCATMFAAVAICAMLITQPASAAQVYFNAPTASSEISGNLWTKYFSARLNLIEYNNQLMLNKVMLDTYNRQYVSEPYPVEFSFKGKDWTAELTSPIRMGINNMFRPDGSYESVIQANVNFTVTEFGRPETHLGLATVHLVQNNNFNRNDQMLSLVIVDATNPSAVLYNSGNNLTMDNHPDMLTAFLPLVQGRFDARVFTQGNAWAAYGGPVTNYPTYNYPTVNYGYPVSQYQPAWPSNLIAMN